SQYDLPGTFAPVADWGLMRAAVEQADNLGVRYHVGNILSSDIFYNAQPDAWKKWAAMGVLGVEMEAAALYMTATHLGAKALCILTVSDSLVTWEETTAEEREKTFTDMMKIALEIA
ncbi:MAG: purine-nucleoside phosphorylase, partial [Culicoidibacterales bacterium]